MKTYKELNADFAIQSVAMPLLPNKLVYGEKRAKSKEVEKHSSTLEKLEAKYEAKIEMMLRNEYKAIKEKTVELQERLTKVQKKSSELQEGHKKLQAKIESSTEILHAHSMESKKHDSRYLLSDRKDLERKREQWQKKSKKLENKLEKLESESLTLKGRIEENNILLESLFKKKQEIKSAWNKIIEFVKSIIIKVKSLLPGHSDKHDLAKKESQNSKGIEVGNPPSYEEAMAEDERKALEKLEALRDRSRSEVEDDEASINSGIQSDAKSTAVPSVTEQELAEPNLSALKAKRTERWVKAQNARSDNPSKTIRSQPLDRLGSIDYDVPSSDIDTTANILLLYEQAEMEYKLENPDAYIRAESIDSEISLPEKRKQYTETMAMERTGGATSSPAALLNMQQMAAVHDHMVKRCDNILKNELPNSSVNGVYTEHSSGQPKHKALKTEVKSPISYPL